MAGIEVKISADTAKLTRELGAVARRQIPFATALALSRIAGHVQRAERDVLPKRFTIRSKRVPADVRMDLTRKKEWPNPEVHVGHRFGAMQLHEKGGTRLPGTLSSISNSEIYIPTRIVASQRGRNGAIPGPLRPASLLRRGLVERVEVAGLGHVLRLKQRVERNAKGRIRWGANRINKIGINTAGFGESRILYLARPSVRIRARYGFVQTAQLEVDRRYEGEFLKALDFALATAR